MFRVVILLALGFGLAVQGVQAQNYPNRPITYYFPFTPGPYDVTIRPIFEKFKERTGQPIIVEPRTGASGQIALQALLRAPADGYAIGFVGTGLPTQVAINILPFGLDDFAPITRVTSLDQCLVVGPHVPAKTMAEFIAWGKTRPQVVYSMVAVSQKLILTARLVDKFSIPWVDTPYKGTPETLLAILSGNGDFAIITLNETAIGMQKEGKLKILGHGSEKRSRYYPDIPTLSETVPGMVIPSWTGVLTSAKTPAPMVSFLFRELTFAMKQPDVLQKMGEVSKSVDISASPEEYAKSIRAEADLYERTARAAGIVKQPLQ